jgi:hypothetical protein
LTRYNIIRKRIYRRGRKRRMKWLLVGNNYMIRLLSRSCLFGKKCNKWSREEKLLFDLMANGVREEENCLG